jgi:hypothetical protein
MKLTKREILENAPIYLNEVNGWLDRSLSPSNEDWTIGHFVVFIKAYRFNADNHKSRYYVRLIKALITRFPSWKKVIENAKAYMQA